MSLVVLDLILLKLFHCSKLPLILRGKNVQQKRKRKTHESVAACCFGRVAETTVVAGVAVQAVAGSSPHSAAARLAAGRVGGPDRPARTGVRVAVLLLDGRARARVVLIAELVDALATMGANSAAARYAAGREGRPLGPGGTGQAAARLHLVDRALASLAARLGVDADARPSRHAHFAARDRAHRPRGPVAPERT